MSTSSWLRPLIASWKIKIIGLPAAMSTPSLAATALIMASWEVKIIRLPAMSAPSLAVTAIRLAVYTKKIWLACNVCALVGCNRRRRAGQ